MQDMLVTLTATSMKKLMDTNVEKSNSEKSSQPLLANNV